MVETDNPFEKVLDRLREKGWQKGGYGPAAGPNCIAGAAMYVEQTCPFDILDKLVGEQYPERAKHQISLGITAFFNDHSDTTFTDVERVLEKAAVKWEEERVMRDD